MTPPSVWQVVLILYDPRMILSIIGIGLIVFFIVKKITKSDKKEQSGQSEQIEKE